MERLDKTREKKRGRRGRRIVANLAVYDRFGKDRRGCYLRDRRMAFLIGSVPKKEGRSEKFLIRASCEIQWDLLQCP